MHKIRRSTHLILFTLLLASCFPSVGLAALLAQDNGSGDLAAQAASTRADYARSLEKLAAWCLENAAPELAHRTTAWAFSPHPRLNYIFLPPDRSEEPAAESQSAIADEWRQRFATLRNAQAEALFVLAEQAAEAGLASRALELANETLRENPNHEQARALFGYSREGETWLTAFEAAKAKAGEIWDDRFGWISQDDLPRYEAGERRNRAYWVSAERDAELHANIDNGWRIETEHYSITTNHSLEAGVALGQRLELLYDAWRQIFADYYLLGSQVRGAFGRGLPSPRRKFRVMYFADEDDFRRALARELPENVQTTGVYLAKRKTSYFYHADPEDFSTQYHEATHQLFQEVPSRTQLEPGREADFWLVEGIACYMESLHRHEPRESGSVAYLTTGGVDATRVQDARFYLFRNDFHEPLTDVSALNRIEFQRHPEIRKVYAQGGAMADMLLHTNGGAYQPALCKLLQAIYQGRRTSLPQLTEQSFTALDELYLSHMEVGDDDLSGRALGADVPYLALGGTNITDSGLAQLTDLEQVRWIDLAKTRVTDAGVRHLAEIKSLVELDLSATPITDAALESLAGATGLRKLTITGTQVSEPAVRKLKQIRPQLEIVR